MFWLPTLYMYISYSCIVVDKKNDYTYYFRRESEANKARVDKVRRETIRILTHSILDLLLFNKVEQSSKERIRYVKSYTILFETSQKISQERLTAF